MKSASLMSRYTAAVYLPLPIRSFRRGRVRRGAERIVESEPTLKASVNENESRNGEQRRDADMTIEDVIPTMNAEIFDAVTVPADRQKQWIVGIRNSEGKLVYVDVIGCESNEDTVVLTINPNP